MSDVNITNNTGNKEADMKELKKLQQRLNHEAIRYQFRTKLVGGLNEEDVTKYIEDLEDKLKKIEQDYKKSSDEIYSLKTKLCTELEQKDNIQADLDKAKQNLVTSIVEFKQKQMEYKSLNEKYNCENLKLKNEIQQMTEEHKTLENIVAKINKEKELLKHMVAKAEEDNKIISMKVSELEEEQIYYDNIKNQNKKITHELKEIEILLSQSTIECEQLKKISEKLSDENNLLQIRIAEMTEENIHIHEIKNENIQMYQEIKAYEELFSQTSIEYEQLQANANKLQKENIQLNQKVYDLKDSIAAKDYKINELNKVCTELNEQVKIEKSNSEKLNMESILLKQKNNSLQETINEKLKELDEQKRINEDTALELSIEKAESLNYKINGFKDEFASIYIKMESLELEAKQSSKLNSILKQQLAIQQNRAEKAESDIAKIIELLSQIEDKFYNKRDILGDEFIQLIEKQKSRRPQINDKIINL